MTRTESAENIIAFPDLESLKQQEKLTLALHALSDDLPGGKHKQLLDLAIEQILRKEQIQVSLNALKQQHVESRYQQDLRITLLEDQLIWLAERLSSLQTRTVDLEDFSSYKRALENIETIQKHHQKNIDDTLRVLEPYGSRGESDMADAVRRIVIEARAKNYQMDELKKDGETGQQEVKRLLQKLVNAKAETEQSLEEVSSLKQALVREQAEHKETSEESLKLKQRVKQAKDSLLNTKVIRQELEQKIAENHIVIEALESRLAEEIEQTAKLTNEKGMVQRELAKTEAKLAIKNEYASTVAAERTSLTDSVQPLQKQLRLRNQWLGGTTASLILALGFIAWQNYALLSRLFG